MTRRDSSKRQLAIIYIATTGSRRTGITLPEDAVDNQCIGGSYSPRAIRVHNTAHECSKWAGLDCLPVHLQRIGRDRSMSQLCNGSEEHAD
jgi:hypothetical protein